MTIPLKTIMRWRRYPGHSDGETGQISAKRLKSIICLATSISMGSHFRP
jgi:hypothetical protein